MEETQEILIKLNDICIVQSDAIIQFKKGGLSVVNNTNGVYVEKVHVIQIDNNDVHVIDRTTKMYRKYIIFKDYLTTIIREYTHS